jgi:hypothetical protein
LSSRRNCALHRDERKDKYTVTTSVGYTRKQDKIRRQTNDTEEHVRAKESFQNKRCSVYIYRIIDQKKRKGNPISLTLAHPFTPTVHRATKAKSQQTILETYDVYKFLPLSPKPAKKKQKKKGNSKNKKTHTNKPKNL